MTHDDHAALWNKAKAAAQAAATEQEAKLGNARGTDCGFAWVTLPGDIAFAKWAKKAGITHMGHPNGLRIYESELHSISTQAVSVHEAAAIAARNVLARGLQTSLIAMGSRLD